MPGDPRPSEFSQSLLKLGLTDKAARVEETGRKSAQRDGNNDKWWLYVPWDSHLRTSRGYAERQSREQVTKFSCLRDLINESFGVLTLILPLTLDPKRGTEKQMIFMLRGIIKRIIPNSIYKIGALGDYIAIKVISVDPFSEVPIPEYLLPRSVRVEWSNRPAVDFDSCLRRLLSADLPAHDNDRARLEYVLERIHQVALFGTAYAQISKSNDSSEKFARNLLKIKDRPRNPITLAPATCYVPPRINSITFDDIDARDWHQYQDYIETDATTPQQHAEMLASLEPEIRSSAPDPPRDDPNQHQQDNPKCPA